MMASAKTRYACWLGAAIVACALAAGCGNDDPQILENSSANNAKNNSDGLPDGSECSSDSDCAGTCGGDNVCEGGGSGDLPDGSACSSDGDCAGTCGAGNVCEGGSGGLPDGSACSSDSDCAGTCGADDVCEGANNSPNNGGGLPDGSACDSSEECAGTCSDAGVCEGGDTNNGQTGYPDGAVCQSSDDCAGSCGAQDVCEGGGLPDGSPCGTDGDCAGSCGGDDLCDGGGTLPDGSDCDSAAQCTGSCGESGTCEGGNNGTPNSTTNNATNNATNNGTNNSTNNGTNNLPVGDPSSMSVSGTFYDDGDAHVIDITDSCPNWKGTYSPTGDEIAVWCGDASADMYGVHLFIKRPTTGASLTEPTFTGDDMQGHVDVGSYNDPDGNFGGASCIFVPDCMATSSSINSPAPSEFSLTIDAWDAQMHEISGSAMVSWNSRVDEPWADDVQITFDLNFDCNSDPCPLVE